MDLTFPLTIILAKYSGIDGSSSACYFLDEEEGTVSFCYNPGYWEWRETIKGKTADGDDWYNAFGFELDCESEDDEGDAITFQTAEEYSAFLLEWRHSSKLA